MSFREVKPEELTMNPFTKIGKEWLLITAGNEEKCNTMTASWGAMGVMWGKNAVKGYREINLRAMKLVKDGGFLATCSCSHFMDYELFTRTIGQAAKNVHKRLRQVEYRTQAPDHPILWSADESYYLKFYIFQVCNDR